ncbi:MAG TPA: hypothetical protein VJ599_00425 [Nitrososphaeraceae archaeon]|nr:hypothetical protein [Nitrososphaeraceae archaeon]
MRRYQILILFGSILAISASSLFYFTGPVVSWSPQGWVYSTRTIEMNIQQIPTLVLYVIIPYVVATIIAFTIKEYIKFIGIGLIILALYTWWVMYNMTGHSLLATMGFGLFLAAGILAIRFRSKLNKSP